MTHPAPNAGFMLGVAAVIAASVLSSIGWVLEGEAVARLSPLAVACTSHLLGALCLLSLARMRGPGPSLDLIKAQGLRLFFFGIIRNALCTLMFATCLTLTSSAKVMFLTKIEPYLILLVDWFVYRQRTEGRQIAILAVHILGAILLSTSGKVQLSGAVAGDLLLVTAIFINALYYRPAQRLAHEFGSMWASGLSQLCGGVVLLPLMLLFSSSHLSFTEGRAVGWGYVVGTVLVFYVASTSLWFFSLKSVPAWINSALRCVGPVVAAPIAWLVFNEVLTPVQLGGAAIVVGTSILMIVVERSPKSALIEALPKPQP